MSGTPVRFRRVAVLGLGLLGGSVAAAAKRSGIAGDVVGSTRSNDAIALALERGWVDRVTSPVEAVADADLVVLATPVYAMPNLVRSVAPALAEGAIVTDVGSVKAQLADRLPGLMPDGACYVGSHPMAGSHARGIEYSNAALFDGATCIVTGTPKAPATDRVCAFWRALGARVVLRSPDEHDAEVAWTSHIPHALAFAFGSAFANAPEGAREVAGSGFRDFTRIAHSDPELWGDILTANAKALAAPIAELAERIAALGRAIGSEDSDAVERLIANARLALAEVVAPDQENFGGPIVERPATRGDED